MSMKLLVLLFSLLIVFSRPKLIANTHLSPRISPFHSSIPPFIAPSQPFTSQSPAPESSLPFKLAMFAEKHLSPRISPISSSVPPFIAPSQPFTSQSQAPESSLPFEPALFADKHLSPRTSPFSSSVPPFIPPSQPFTSQSPAPESSLPFVPVLFAEKHLSPKISPFYSSIPLVRAPSLPFTSQSPAVEASLPFVPALFVFGDSSVDCGTNNFLGTLAKADRLPYGRDFDTHQPTGRFSNGRIPVDYLANRLGLPLVPSYLGQTGTVEDMFQGVNYASAGAGIILSSGSELGQRVSFAMQIEQFVDTFQQMILSIGEEASDRLVSNSVFYISIGVNDYIHFYIRNISSVQDLYTPWNFNQFLASNLRQELKTLYNVKVRRMVVMGLPPIGCAPYYLWKYKSQNGECAEEVNSMIMESNFVMRYTVDQLNRELPGASIIYCDVLQSAMDILKNHHLYGFNVTTDACCGLGRYKGWLPCISPEMACSDASGHLWWDQFHPTDAVNAILADNKMELDYDASNLVEDEAGEVGHNDMDGIEGERCGICMDIIIDRGVLDCCQHWFCFECIDNWSSIMNLCPLCQREFQLITCVPVYDSGESSKVDEVSLSGDEDWCIEEEPDAVSSPSHYIDENAVICLDGDLCKIRNSFNYIGGDSNLDTSIACDSCDTWYHALCVGFDLEIASEDTWVCPRCLSFEKPLEPDVSPMETRKSPDISERTNSGCSAEAVCTGNFSVTVADEGETALVVSIVKGDKLVMKPSDNTPSSVEVKMDGDPDSSHLEICCRKENTEQVPEKSELSQSLLHDISSELPSDSNQPLFAAHMENRADPVTRLEDNDCLPLNDKKSLSSTAISNSDVTNVISLKREHSDCSGADDNSETKPVISESLHIPKLEEKEELATIHYECRSPSNNTTVDIFSIVEGTGRKRNLMRPNPTDKSSEGENAGLRVKKIKRTPADDKESLVLVEKLRKEIREAVRNRSMEDISTNQFDPKLLAAFRAAVAGPKTDEAPTKLPALAVKAKKLMLQKGKVRENLTKKIYADLNGKRKSAWHRDCEVEFWKHRCIKTRKPEKIETLKSVLSLLKKKPTDTKTKISFETPQASNPMLSRLYLADTSVFPRNDNLKPLLAPKETGNSQNNAKPTEADKTLPKISDAKGSSSKATGSKLNSGNKQSDGQSNLTSSNSKEIFENSEELKKDKRKWALQVLARKKALAGNNSTEDKEGSPELKGNYPLLAQLPADMRPSLATSRHNKVPVAVRQVQLYRLAEHFLKKENLVAVRRSAATELAVADAINIEKAIADKSSSKVMYLNLCSQEILHHSESKKMDNTPNSSSPPADNGSERISDKDLDDPAVLQALRAAGLADSPPNSPTRSTEIPPEKGDSSLDKAREADPVNVLDLDSIPDTDIFGDFEYELDEEDYIGPNMATKASETQPDEGLPKKEATNGEEDGKSFVPMEPVPEAEAEGEGEGEGGEILSVAECEELYGPGTEKLVEKPLIEGSADNGVQAKAPDSECESNTHREFIASNFVNSSVQAKKLPKNIQKSNPSEKPSKEEKSKADGLSNSVTKKVEAYIKEHIRPLCKSGVINVEQYRWSVTKTTEKVMKYHSKAKSANFLIKEGDKIKKLAEQYVETASSGAHHKDKCKRQSDAS
ncbi:hypothetical protein V5N11_007558 [Cardamine amara subsp. amara]|uniref:Uncharacterized protein n=1 Tax=Cardamine amara subsp. amara TaxID=228776 RepID=A0ABD0ZZ07_CARAN